jgi:hypothetical protein
MLSSHLRRIIIIIIIIIITATTTTTTTIIIIIIIIIIEHRAMKAYWGVGYSSTTSLNSTLDGGECLTSRPGLFTPRPTASGSHWIEGRMHDSKRCGEAKSI